MFVQTTLMIQDGNYAVTGTAIIIKWVFLFRFWEKCNQYSRLKFNNMNRYSWQWLISSLSCYVISHHITSYHLISYHTYHITSSHLISYHIISYHITSYHFKSMQVSGLKYKRNNRDSRLTLVIVGKMKSNVALNYVQMICSDEFDDSWSEICCDGSCKNHKMCIHFQAKCGKYVFKFLHLKSTISIAIRDSS